MLEKTVFNKVRFNLNRKKLFEKQPIETSKRENIKTAKQTDGQTGMWPERMTKYTRQSKRDAEEELDRETKAEKII